MGGTVQKNLFPNQGGDDALFRFKVSVEMADMLLRNAPEDKIYIQQILEMAKKRGIT